MEKTRPSYLFSRYLLRNKKVIKTNNKRWMKKTVKKKQQGAAGIEAVLLLPLVLLLLFAIIHYSMIFFAASLFEHAAKEGIRNSMSYVDERCYFTECDAAEIEDIFRRPITDNTAAVIQNFTGGTGDSLGVLFGVDLGNKNGDTIDVKLMSDGDCCQVKVSLQDYASEPFLPTEMIDGLLPGDGSVFPEDITATASMKLN
ncbi:TadE/TadG family type IV pilus assembly protein [Vibrio sp.]|uniref:TadE/TadG family type IV pilus assembly protein n=1 Tax=Vibrio sp. TaxID=678 RepID=UPI003AA9ADDB